MTKNTKTNLVLSFWLIVLVFATKGTYDANLTQGTQDAFLIACFPAIPTTMLAIVLSVRLTK